MKVAVITRHAITNYGSLLQALATQIVIEKMGHECRIIDYVRKDEHYTNYEKSILQTKKDWNDNKIKKYVYLFLRLPESKYAGKRFEKERQKLLNLTSEYSTNNELKNACLNYDVFMTGSDQVWGPVIDGSIDETYFLSFTKNKKIAYASSFGRLDFANETLKKIKGLLETYSNIAVRENSAVDLLKKLNINAAHVLDPTLLLSSDEWDQYCRPITNRNYLLVYQIHNDPQVGKVAKTIANKKGLRIIRISAHFHQIIRNGHFKYCPSIGLFLSYIKNAKYMVTDSFHGTAFAINYNIQFAEVVPNNGTGTRNKDILDMTGLSNRIVYNIDDINEVLQFCDYSSVNAIIKENRKQSLDTLKKMIEE